MTDKYKKAEEDREFFNNLPLETRRVLIRQNCRLRIQHLLLEKDRLKSNYQRSLKEINEHIKNCEKGLA